jgi:signal transduction histidine kinase
MFVAIVVTASLAFAFARSVTRQSLWPVFPLLGLALGGAAIIFAMPSWIAVAPRAGGGWWPRPSLGALIVAVLATGPLAGAVYGLASSYAATPPSLRRRQLGWTLTAVLCGVAGVVDAHTIFTGIYPINWATGAASCLAQAYSLLQDRLLAFRTVLRRSFLAVAAGTVGALALLALFSVTGTSEMGVPLLLAGLLLLFMAARLWVSNLEPSFDRWLDGRRRRIQRALRAFEQATRGARGLADVADALRLASRAGFDAELLALVPPAEVPPGLLALSAPLVRDILDEAAPARAVMDALGADALLPLEADRTFVGVAVLAGPGLQPGDDVLVEDLARLGDVASRAWLSARLYEEVARRSEGLEAQVQARTAQLAQALDELRLAQTRLVQAERSSSLGLLVAGVSHEINNALNFISANLPTARRYIDDSSAFLDAAPALVDARSRLPATLDQLGGSVRRTSAIVADLRRFARPDNERRVFRVDEGIETALRLLAHRAAGRVDVGLLCGGNLHIDGHPGPFNQCLLAVLTNAVEAAHEEIWISASEQPSGGVSVTIVDDGPGIAPEWAERVFQPFVSGKPDGSGLGLTVARQIVERSGGRIWIEQAAGGGCAVVMFLPRQAPETGHRR